MEDKVDIARIQNTLGKMDYHLATHNSICVGVSGGSDSNVILHMIATKFRQYLPKIHFVFENTGMEYRATLRHLDTMENSYGVQIERIHGESIPSVVKKEGFPILSKKFSTIVKYAERQSAWALVCIGRLPPDGKTSLFLRYRKDWLNISWKIIFRSVVGAATSQKNGP